MPSRRTPSSPAPAPAVHNFPTTAPRELRLDVRAGEPFAPLDEFLRAFEGRVLLAADSGGRREVLSEMLRAHRHAVQLVPSWSAFLATEARLALTVAPDIEGLTLTTVPPIAVISEAQLFGPRAPPGASPQAAPSIPRRSCATCRTSIPGRRWCTRNTASAATRG